MEPFKHYGKLEKIANGEGKLYLNGDKSIKVTFVIAKKGEEKLLFNATYEGADAFSTLEIFNLSAPIKLIGSDSRGRKVKGTELLIKDTETNSNGSCTINGYVGKCEIGQKKFNKDLQVSFHLTNFLFVGNNKGALDLQFPDIAFTIEKIEDYKVTRKLLKRQNGILQTSVLKVTETNNVKLEILLKKVQKLCQLLSVARSTFINWISFEIKDNQGKLVYELYGNSITRSYRGNSLISDLPKQTISFLSKAWEAYDEYKTIFDTKRFFYGYIDTYVTNFIESRSLNIAVLVDFLSSRWAIKEDKEYLLDQKEFEKQEADITKKLSAILDDSFDNLKPSHKQAILSNVNGFNDRPLDWKLKRLRKQFQIPIVDNEIDKFIEIRNSLAHRSLFPNGFDSQQSYLFMRHFLDRIVLSVLGYEGKYFDIQNRAENILNGS